LSSRLLYLMVSTLNPIVGVVGVAWPSFNACKIADTKKHITRKMRRNGITFSTEIDERWKIWLLKPPMIIVSGEYKERLEWTIRKHRTGFAGSVETEQQNAHFLRSEKGLEKLRNRLTHRMCARE
jgi:hypothetical protein